MIALLALAAPAGAAKAATYKGKTSSGHKISFQIKNGRIHDLTAPIGTFTIYSCLGGGTFKAKAS